MENLLGDVLGEQGNVREGGNFLDEAFEEET